MSGDRMLPMSCSVHGDGSLVLELFFEECMAIEL
jgi:hypothetical protein